MSRRALLLLLCLLTLSFIAGCGKKAPPQPPDESFNQGGHPDENASDVRSERSSAVFPAEGLEGHTAGC